MIRNHIHCTPRGPVPRPLRLAWLALAVVLGVPMHAQPQADLADRLPPEIRERFVPSVAPLKHESLVARSALFDVLPGNASMRATMRSRWQAWGGAVLNTDERGLTLHYYAQGIKAMTTVDKLWEGLPKRADSLQSLMDEAIGRARSTGRPIDHLIIAGHAGLPGCSALGGTLEDCTFRGVLTGYQRRQLARLGPYLASDAEIELRQCGTGSGDEGRRLLDAIYQATGVATSSYLADFHFGDAANHPRVRVGPEGFEIVRVED